MFIFDSSIEDVVVDICQYLNLIELNNFYPIVRSFRQKDDRLATRIRQISSALSKQEFTIHLTLIRQILNILNHNSGWLMTVIKFWLRQDDGLSFRYVLIYILNDFLDEVVNIKQLNPLSLALFYRALISELPNSLLLSSQENITLHPLYLLEKSKKSPKSN